MDGLSEDLVQQSFATLHGLSRTWHMLLEDMTDWHERTAFILDVQRQYLEACNVLGYDLLHAPPPTIDSLQFLLSRTNTWKRWVANYNTRTTIRINMFFNLATQADSKTNLQIASTSKMIAAEPRKDSLSMITIAAVTMTFLPGTFVTVCGLRLCSIVYTVDYS